MQTFMTIGMASPPAQDGEAPQGSPFDIFLPLGITLAIVYFLMLRPQQKKAESHRKLIEGLKKGDYVLANAGFYGRVMDVEKRIVTLEIANNVKIKVLRDAIAAIDRPEDEATAK